jgi:hypothetical protein
MDGPADQITPGPFVTRCQRALVLGRCTDPTARLRGLLRHTRGATTMLDEAEAIREAHEINGIFQIISERKYRNLNEMSSAHHLRQPNLAHQRRATDGRHFTHRSGREGGMEKVGTRPRPAPPTPRGDPGDRA